MERTRDGTPLPPGSVRAVEPVATSSDEDELIRCLTGWATEGAGTSLAGVAGLLLERAEGLLGFPLHPLLRRVYEGATS